MACEIAKDDYYTQRRGLIRRRDDKPAWHNAHRLANAMDKSQTADDEAY